MSQPSLFPRRLRDGIESAAESVVSYSQWIEGDDDTTGHRWHNHHQTADAIIRATMDERDWPVYTASFDSEYYRIARLVIRKAKQMDGWTGRYQQRKTCPTCGEQKSVARFHKNGAMRDGLQSTCKTCHKEQKEAA